MGFALSKDFADDYRDHTVSTPLGLGNGRLATKIIVTKTLRKSVAISAAVALAPFTTSTVFSENVVLVTPEVQGNGMIDKEVSLAVLPHLVDSYAEMASYKGLIDGWDGVGSVKPDEHTIDNALAFLQSLPPDTAAPEPGVTADGYAEWYWTSKQGVATVSFKGTGMAYYARVGKDKANRSIIFDGRSIPTDLAATIAQI